MNKTFCVSCGFKNLYEATKPKFCASCGDPVNGVSKASSVSHEEDEADIDVGGIDLEKLRRGIRADIPSGIKIEEVIGTGGVDDQPLRRRASNLPDGQEMIKRSISDCAPSHQPKDIDG